MNKYVLVSVGLNVPVLEAFDSVFESFLVAC